MFNWGNTKDIITDEEKIEALLERGVDEVIDKELLKKRLLSGERLRIKLGIDPTSPDLHLGRTIPLLKMRDFQELGHQVVLIVGDFTGIIGDTSDKDAERPMLSREVLEENKQSYFEQAGKIIDLKSAELRYNSKWLSKLDYDQIGEQADLFSVNQFIQRDNIRKRLDDGKRVSLREVLYPLMQGYDSVAVEADVELGGTDQRFNLLSGRTMQEHFKQKPQSVVMGPLIEGLDGRKMSSSWGNTIAVVDEPGDMFGKVMSMSDDLIIKYFTLLTRVPIEEVEKYQKELESGTNPRDIKMKLAHDIVRMYHGDTKADEARDSFVETFSKGNTPDYIETVKAEKGKEIVDVLVPDYIESKSQFRRLVESGGLHNLDNDGKINDPKFSLSESVTLKIGKKKFLKIEVN